MSKLLKCSIKLLNWIHNFQSLTIIEVYIFYKGLGTSLDELKRYDEAIKMYDKAIQLNPSYSEAYNNKG